MTTVKILDAVYSDGSAEKESDRNTYKVKIECIEGGADAGASALLTYWLKEKGTDKYSAKTLGTLKSLGKAVFGDAFKGDAPMPGDIIGAVVYEVGRVSPLIVLPCPQVLMSAFK